MLWLTASCNARSSWKKPPMSAAWRTVFPRRPSLRVAPSCNVLISGRSLPGPARHFAWSGGWRLHHSSSSERRTVHAAAHVRAPLHRTGHTGWASWGRLARLHLHPRRRYNGTYHRRGTLPAHATLCQVARPTFAPRSPSPPRRTSWRPARSRLAPATPCTSRRWAVAIWPRALTRLASTARSCGGWMEARGSSLAPRG